MPVTRHLKRRLLSGTGKRPTIVPPALLPTGVYRASTSRYCWCALTAPLHPYQPILNLQSQIDWRYFSVALSSRSLALGVIQQVWSFGSPDFPQTSISDLQLPRPTLPLFSSVNSDCHFCVIPSAISIQLSAFSFSIRMIISTTKAHFPNFKD